MAGRHREASGAAPDPPRAARRARHRGGTARDPRSRRRPSAARWNRSPSRRPRADTCAGSRGARRGSASRCRCARAASRAPSGVGRNRGVAARQLVEILAVDRAVEILLAREDRVDRAGRDARGVARCRPPWPPRSPSRRRPAARPRGSDRGRPRGGPAGPLCGAFACAWTRIRQSPRHELQFINTNGSIPQSNRQSSGERGPDGLHRPTRRTIPAMSHIDFAAFDADNHYYEAADAFTRHIEPKFARRCMQWAQVDGKKAAGRGPGLSVHPQPDLRSRRAARLPRRLLPRPQSQGLGDEGGSSGRSSRSTRRTATATSASR